MEMEGNSLPSASCADGRKRRVCYYYDPGIANVDYGEGHPMVPRRVAMADALISSYGLLADMDRLRTTPATQHDLLKFHDDGYLNVLRDASSHTGDELAKRHVGNPAIDGLWDYCLRYSGGSLAAARALCGRESDVAVNWSGGMHHACCGRASGFCFVNDIVLAVQELCEKRAKLVAN